MSVHKNTRVYLALCRMTKVNFFTSVLITSLLFFTNCGTIKSADTNPTSSSNPNSKSSEEVHEYSAINFNYTADLDGAMVRAKKENKSIFIDFYTTWCAPCKLMDQGTFKDDDIATYLNDNCVTLKVNAEKGNGRALRVQYNVAAFPTLIFIDPDGNVVSQKEGSLGIDGFKQFMKAAVWKYKGN